MGLVFNLVRLLGISALGALLLRTRESLIALGVIFGLVVGTTIYKNMTAKLVGVPPSTPVPEGKIRICVAGGTHSAPTAKAHELAALIAKRYPTRFETWFYFDQYAYWLFIRKFDTVPFPPHLKGHSTTPFVWFERGATNVIEPIGGSTDLSKWALDNLDDEQVKTLAKEPYSATWYLTGRSFHCPGAAATAK